MRRQRYSMHDREVFWRALEAYKAALRSRDSNAIILASIRIHVAKGGVPKSYWPHVNRAFNECYTSN